MHICVNKPFLFSGNQYGDTKAQANPSLPFVPTFTPSNAAGSQFLTGPMIPNSGTQPQLFNPVMPSPQVSNLSTFTPSPLLPQETVGYSAASTNSMHPTPTNYYSPTPDQTNQSQPGDQFPNQQASYSPTEYNISPFASMNSQNNAANVMASIPKVTPHWFYLRTWTIQLPFYKVMTEWVPFSRIDSHNLEHEFLLHHGKGNSTTVQTDGGRYDVNLSVMSRQAVYWKEEVSVVRRCTWFYKEENQFIPYEADLAEKLEVLFLKLNTCYSVSVSTITS